MELRQNRLAEDSPLLYLAVGVCEWVLACGVCWFLLRFLDDKATVASMIPTRLFAVLGVAYAAAVSLFPPVLMERTVMPYQIMGRVAYTTTLMFILVPALSYYFLPVTIVGSTLVWSYLIITPLLMTGRCVARSMFATARRNGRNLQYSVIVGNPALAPHLVVHLRRPEAGCRIMAAFYDGPESSLAKCHGTLAEAFDYIKQHSSINAVYCLGDALQERDYNNLYTYCENKNIRLHFIHRTPNLRLRSLVMTEQGSITALVPQAEALTRFANRWLKRGLDIIVSLFVLLFVFPFVYIGAALVIKRKGGGPVFDISECKGLDGRTFRRISFRSLEGGVARMPQFINVLVGTMSVVGPQCVEADAEEASGVIIKRYGVCHYAKPGITGWAQVNARGNSDNPAAQLQRQLHHDVWYLEHWTLWLDIQIIFSSLLPKAN